MKFFDKVLLKQNVKSEIDAIDLICEKAEECLEPLVDIYIVHLWGNGAEYDSKKLKDLSLSLTSLSSYLKQLHTATTKLKTDMDNDPELLRRFKKMADLSLKNVEKLHKDIFELDLDIRKLPDYEKHDVLLRGIGYLTRLEKEINEMNGVPIDVVPKSTKLNVNSAL